MVMKSIVPLAITSLALGLSSCGMKSTMANFKEKITPDIKMPEMKMPEVKRGDIARFSFRDLLPSSVPIVEVDTKKLKEIETGKQKAMAYQGLAALPISKNPSFLLACSTILSSASCLPNQSSFWEPLHRGMLRLIFQKISPSELWNS
jgi:hypothetical protein